MDVQRETRADATLDYKEKNSTSKDIFEFLFSETLFKLPYGP